MTTPIEIGTQKTLSYVIIVLVVAMVVCVFVRQLLMLWNFASGWAKHDDEDDYSGVPTVHEHEWESGADKYTISLASGSHPRSNPLHDPDDAYDVPDTIRLASDKHRA
ncbi:hypothetical protein SPRG_20499 [Saprolegnia parasitica CBS 223.65]|uniref:Uncharacterized protein n=1 Tax=Saprolegnia parasitica (strain CBS 223.65) TaxID=695850 RepID=A0A067CJK8_SAPPC|nr:hypothetical protein SPRG_20499 [Saprolegnia parasitica CBS 223.65]KDO26701.1 hypothetical protein SPRG_20499 [Saprolegnia parasitica CBS 223.65]|eukprot:XP_012202589.1 hypothetical protein SPRG_20499 [Saprolegnia parasitica CBS 223.65]